jgi:hypothetical protein
LWPLTLTTLENLSIANVAFVFQFELVVSQPTERVVPFPVTWTATAALPRLCWLIAHKALTLCHLAINRRLNLFWCLCHDYDRESWPRLDGKHA